MLNHDQMVGALEGGIVLYRGIPIYSSDNVPSDATIAEDNLADTTTGTIGLGAGSAYSYNYILVQ